MRDLEGALVALAYLVVVFVLFLVRGDGNRSGWVVTKDPSHHHGLVLAVRSLVNSLARWVVTHSLVFSVCIMTCVEVFQLIGYNDYFTWSLVQCAWPYAFSTLLYGG